MLPVDPEDDSLRKLSAWGKHEDWAFGGRHWRLILAFPTLVCFCSPMGCNTYFECIVDIRAGFRRVKFGHVVSINRSLGPKVDTVYLFVNVEE